MTAKQFLTKNKFTMNDRFNINIVVTLEMKLRKHLINQNDARVRDYIIAIRVFWPKNSESPISFKIFNNALYFLESRGWQMDLDEDHSKRISRYVTRAR
ncbi:MAG: hypothetical protein ACYC0Q_14450 [Eubacteriales bacterium]